MSKYEPDKIESVYKCTGNIKNLRLKVRLEVKKSSIIPLSNVEEQETGLNPQSNDVEEREFLWQQKVFSPAEIARYSNKEYCQSPLELEYHKQVEKAIVDNKDCAKNRLFSYVAKDHFSETLWKDVLLDKRGSECIRKLHIFTLTDSVSEETSNNAVIPRRNIVINNPPDELKTRNRTLTAAYNLMHILADLSENNCSEKSFDSNHLLVSLKWDPRNGTLSVFPDFVSLDSAGYKIEDDGIKDSRREYRYWVINMSECKNENVEKIPNQEDVLEIFVFAEIQKAVGFEYDHLYVEYFVHLPPGWSSESSLSGTTLRSRYGKIENTAIFSHLFDFKLSIKLDKPESDDLENSVEFHCRTECPQLFIKVVSLDNWGCCRIEGYSYAVLPLSPGIHCLLMRTWRPCPSTPADELRRFFIGSPPELNDPLYTGTSSEKNRLLSKYGFKTISSGDIYVKLNVTRQLNNFNAAKRKDLFASAVLPTSTMINNINDILEAFKRARQRMLIAREPIFSNRQ